MHTYVRFHRTCAFTARRYYIYLLISEFSRTLHLRGTHLTPLVFNSVPRALPRRSRGFLFLFLGGYMFLRFYTDGAKWSGENSSSWQQLRVIEFRICNARFYFSPAVKNPSPRQRDETRGRISFFIIRYSWKISVIMRS